MACDSERVLHTTWQQAVLFRPVPREPLVPQIADQLRQHITLGALRESEKLPALRKLAGLFGVSVPTMRAAIQVLAYLGVVRVSHGVGIFVINGKESHRASVAGLRRANPTELIELRRLLETHAATLMARAVRSAANEQAFGDLDMWAWQRAGRQSVWPEDFLQADLEYHRAILVGAGSTYAVSLHDQVSERLQPSLLADAHRQAASESLVTAHWALAEAIERGVPSRAARLADQIAAAETPPSPPQPR